MLGVNIEQSQPEEETKPKHRGFFDTGTIISIALISLSLLGWGGTRYYIGTLNAKIADAEATLNLDLPKLSGEQVDAISDFESRLVFFGANKNGLYEPVETLKKVEAAMVPGVVLTSYKYDHAEGLTTIEGTTDDFRKLAEQILGFKSQKVFSHVHAQNIGRNNLGQITFTLKANF
mgnify:CR=1 FL=1